MGPMGPMGPSGPAGIQGVAGPAGSQGLAATIDIEDASRVPFDNNPYVINVGTRSEAILRFGIPAGTPGTNGNDGKSAYQIAVDNGFIGTEAQWLESLKGERGPTAAMIPFSTSKYGTGFSTDADGEPSMIGFSGFSPGYAATSYLQEGEWQSGYIHITEDMTYPTSFVMTYDGIIKKLYVLFSTYYSQAVEEGVTIRPFACLAISDTDELTYRILKDTIVYADPYTGGAPYPNHTIRKGSRTDLNTALPEGSLVAIVTGITGTGMQYEQTMTLSLSGGIYLE